MYKDFFNFQSRPFDQVPDPEMLFLSSTHSKALTYLRYGIDSRVGFILLTGEVGAGKTTMIKELVSNHMGENLFAKVFNTKVDSLQLLTMINDDFGLETDGRSKAIMLRDLNEFLIDQYALGRKPVLIIDEAQNLSNDLLEEVRLLSNLETDGGKLLQIILVGQPELRDSMNSPDLIQLRQRIQIATHLKPLTPEDSSEYIFRRMECAGNRDAVSISPEALVMISDKSRGIPRLINIICDYMLIDAFARQSKEVALEDIEQIVDELDFERQYWPTDSSTFDAKEEGSVKGGRIKNKSAEKVLKVIRGMEIRINKIESDLSSTDTGLVPVLLERIGKLEEKVLEQSYQLEQLKAARDLETRSVPEVSEISRQHSFVPEEERADRPNRFWRKVFAILL